MTAADEKMRKPLSAGSIAVVDLFSGAGGMSYGFFRHPAFRIVAAADAEAGKPSMGSGNLQCNHTYFRNVGVEPKQVDLSCVAPSKLRRVLGLPASLRVGVLAVCPPCTGFSRANPNNHLSDDRRNSLVRKAAQFVTALDVDVAVMENARELIRGNFDNHYRWFCEHLDDHGYRVFGKTYLLTKFGLPQIRERAVVIAVKRPLKLRTLEDLWGGSRVDEAALTVKRAFGLIDPKASAVDIYPGFSSGAVGERIRAIPKDGGSWADLLKLSDADRLLTDAMKRIVAKRRFGSYPDVYGRMAWDKPAPTIKRECSHVGNGRYAHPQEDRLCTVREMAMLQGFPNDFYFNGATVSNMYRHIGDAVPPLISFQLAHLCHWILDGRQPNVSEILLPGTNLSVSDVVKNEQRAFLYA